MSRAYRIRVTSSLTHQTKVEDGLEVRLEVLDVLGPDRTAALLQARLREEGWAVDDAGRAHTDVGGVAVEIDTKTQRVTLRRALDQVEEIEATATARTYVETSERDRALLAEKAEQEALAKARQRDAEARKQVSEDLERALVDLVPRLRQLSDAVTRDGLKERAGQMGEILDVAENPESGEMTIRVKV